VYSGSTDEQVLKAAWKPSALWPPILTVGGVLALLLMATFAHEPAMWLLMGLFALCWINYCIGKRDVLYPAFIYSIVWTLVTTAYCFCPIDIDRIGWRTVLVLLAGAVAFSIGSLLGNRPLVKPRSTPDSAARCDNPQARNILFGASLFMTLLLLVNLIRVAGGIFAITPMFLLRLNSDNSPLANAGGITNFIIGSGGLLPVLALWVLIIENERRWKIVVCSVCVLLFPLLVTQRGLLLVAFCGCLTLYLLRSKDRTFSRMARPVGIAAAAIVVIFTLMSFTKGWAQKSSGGFTLTEGAWMYIAGPLAAFNHYLYHQAAYANQAPVVLSQLIEPLSHVQLIQFHDFLATEGTKLDRFVYVPFPANVYTAYKPYYADFGPIGCLAAFAFIGLLEGQLFYRAVRGRPIATLFLAYLASALMFSTFDDLYHSFSRHLNLLVFAVAYFYAMKRIRIRLF
jgi:oligosaccharide repeat unit polymerase